MANAKVIIRLTVMERTEMLSTFIKEFVLQGNTFRKGESNHMSYLMNTINRVFGRYFGNEIKFSHDEIVEAFENNGYKLKEDLMQQWGTSTTGFQNAVWINVDASCIKTLYLTTTRLPAHTNTAKVDEVEAIIARVEKFAKQTTHNDYRANGKVS